MNLRQEITTREIATFTGIPHKTVVSDFEKMLSSCTATKLDANDFLEFYSDQCGEKQKMYRIDLDLSTALAANYPPLQRFKVFRYWYEMGDQKGYDLYNPDQLSMLYKLIFGVFGDNVTANP